MFKLLGESGSGRDVLFVGIEKGDVNRLLAGDSLLIHGQDFASHVTDDFTVTYVESMVSFRACLTIRNPAVVDAYDHSAFYVEGPSLLHVVIDSYVIDLIRQGGLSILTTSKIGWTTDVYLFYRESLQKPGDAEAAEQWLRHALARIQTLKMETGKQYG